ncbi:polysaccharide deacetylase family protein [Salinimicrobium flavum]|uniref:Polysaccharide deacetylase family protein n=1 Tax=Salinimicrobium flavum TaxID=1737065 RepID=A0ABW5IXK8_9FLAO
MIVKIPNIIKRLYPKRVWDGPATGKKIYLTFDDGPIPGVTPWVLEQLKQFNAKATFFCIGENVEKNPGIFREVIAAGHMTGNHTYNHLNGWKTTGKRYLENTLLAREIMERNSPRQELTTGENLDAHLVLFRPPYGKIRESQARQLQKRGFRIVMWDIVSMDYNLNISPERCYLNVRENAGSGSIIVFHDSQKARRNLEYALPKSLEHFSKEGYSFERLEA